MADIAYRYGEYALASTAHKVYGFKSERGRRERERERLRLL